MPSTKGPDTLLRMFVLDVLQFGMQPLQNVMTLLADDDPTGVGWRAYWPRDFTKSEVLDAIRQLIRDADILVWSYDETGHLMKRLSTESDADLDAVWFERTEAGRRRVEAWKPPELPTEKA